MTDETKTLKRKLDIVFFKSLQLNKDDRASVMSNFIGRLESHIEIGNRTIRLNTVIDKLEGSIDSFLNKEKKPPVPWKLNNERKENQPHEKKRKNC